MASNPVTWCPECDVEGDIIDESATELTVRCPDCGREWHVGK